MRMLIFLAFITAFITAGCGSEQTDSEQGSIRVISLNIWHDMGDWPARQGPVIDGLRELDADIICLQEVLQHEELPNQARTIADSLGYHFYFSSVDSMGRARRYGNAILSRTAIDDSSWHALEPLTDYRNAGHVRTSLKNHSIDVYCTHLHHTPTPAGEEIRRAQIEDLLRFVDRTRSADVVLLVGDFNANPEFPELGPITERFEDTYSVVHGDAVRPATLNTHIGHENRWIDYIFVARDAGLPVRDVQRILDEQSADGVWPSDHFGVMAEFGTDRGDTLR